IPMIEHVYRRSILAKSVDSVFVAACDDEIKNFMENINGEVIMTDKEIDRPGIRVAEAAKKLGLNDDDIIVIVQGDEPLIHPESLELGIKILTSNRDLCCVNYCADADEGEWLDTDVVKVVTDTHMNLLYLSRSPIPSNTRYRSAPLLKQLGIFFFTMKNLIEFQNLSAEPLEITESIEHLRALEHGKNIKMIKYPYTIKSVDNEIQRRDVEALMNKDAFWPIYKDKCSVTYSTTEK
ncbi:cytidylyltransferase domain-containing protein, partial [Acidobacteriota bacterium]